MTFKRKRIIKNLLRLIWCNSLSNMVCICVFLTYLKQKIKNKTLISCVLWNSPFPSQFNLLCCVATISLADRSGEMWKAEHFQTCDNSVVSARCKETHNSVRQCLISTGSTVKTCSPRTCEGFSCLHEPLVWLILLILRSLLSLSPFLSQFWCSTDDVYISFLWKFETLTGVVEPTAELQKPGVHGAGSRNLLSGISPRSSSIILYYAGLQWHDSYPESTKQTLFVFVFICFPFCYLKTACIIIQFWNENDLRISYDGMQSTHHRNHKNELNKQTALFKPFYLIWTE